MTGAPPGAPAAEEAERVGTTDPAAAHATAAPRATKVYFELTNSCNFDCDFCPIKKSTRPKQTMDFDLYTKGIDEIVRHGLAPAVGFHVLGDPLLAARWPDAVRYAASRGLRTELTTNGALFDERRIALLAGSGLDKLSISVEAIDEAEHRSRGSRVPFAEYYRRVLDAVRDLRATGAKLEIELLLMNAWSKKFFDVDTTMRLDTRPGVYQEKLLAFVSDIYDAIGKKTDRSALAAALGTIRSDRPVIVRVEKDLMVYVQLFADWGNAFTTRKVHPAPFGCCGYALENVGVLANGEVTICCVDYDGRTSLGNLRDSSLLDMLSSPKARRIREGFRRMRIVEPYCRQCLGGSTRLRAIAKGAISVYLFKMLQFKPARVHEIEITVP